MDVSGVLIIRHFVSFWSDLLNDIIACTITFLLIKTKK